MNNTERIYYSHDAEMQALRGKFILTVFCLACGLGIGAGLALLFAPYTGKNVRKDLGKNIEQSLHNGREAVEPVVKRVEKEFDEIKKTVEEKLR